MSPPQELKTILESLEELKSRSKNISYQEEPLKQFIILQKREQLSQELLAAIKLILIEGKKVARIHATPENRIIVETSLKIIPSGGSSKEAIIPAVINDDAITSLLILHKQEGLKLVDNEKTRVTYLDEFKERFKTTMNLIPLGILDPQFNQLPYEIFHKINGRFGELLPIMGINPEHGRTYKYFLSLMERPKNI